MGVTTTQSNLETVAPKTRLILDFLLGLRTESRPGPELEPEPAKE